MEKEQVREVLSWLLEADGSTIDDIISAAMVKNAVKKSKRVHIRKIVEDAFMMALSQASLMEEKDLLDEELKGDNK